jgi:hypothetical protein
MNSDKIDKILMLKGIVRDLLDYFPDQAGAIDHMRELTEKEAGIDDIPLELYEKNVFVFLDKLGIQVDKQVFYYFPDHRQEPPAKIHGE